MRISSSDSAGLDTLSFLGGNNLDILRNMVKIGK